MNWRRWLGLALSPAPAASAAVAGAPMDAASAAAMDAAMDDMRAGRYSAAAERFERMLEHAPEFAAAHRELARARLELNQSEAAADALSLAAHYAPGDAATAFLQGLLAQRGRDADAATAHYRRALRLDPAMAEAHNNLGYLLVNEYDDIDEGIAHFDAALRYRAGYVDALINLGIADLYAGRRAQAVARFDAVLALNPADADADLARLNRALARLALAQWAQGWDEYEARKRVQCTPRPFAYPEWTGAPAPQHTLLLYGEQGLGDEIMFASCIPDAMRRAGRSVIECSPKLVTLFRRSFAGAEVHGAGAAGAAPWLEQAAHIDLALATGSLPRLFRRSAAAFPRHAGYLAADPQRVAAWRARLAAFGAKPKVALSWRGGTRHTRAARRSLPVAELARHLGEIGADFISLQYGEVEEDIAAFARAGVKLHHWPEAIADYDETAALLSAVDLTLSVCTALIHLGGALGRPVWVLAPKYPEWRYGDSGEAMPWYPSLRVLRAASADWRPLLAQVAVELSARFRP